MLKRTTGIGLAIFGVLLGQSHSNAADDVVISEFKAGNPSDDWIELWNRGTTPVNLHGWILEDKSKTWDFEVPVILPPGDFLIVYATGDGHQGPTYFSTDFKLDDYDDELRLFKPGGLRVSNFNWELGDPERGPHIEGVTFGLDENGNEVFLYHPTPDSANITRPQFSAASGYSDDFFDLEISVPKLQASLKYTVDGSDPFTSATAVTVPPHSGSGLAWVEIDIDGTTVVRAGWIEAGGIRQSTINSATFIYLPSVRYQPKDFLQVELLPKKWPETIWNELPFQPTFPIVNEDLEYNVPYFNLYSNDLRVVESSYPDNGFEFEDALLSLPTLSISMGFDELLDAGTAINCASGLYPNLYSCSEERAASAELIYPDGRAGFSIPCGVQMRGQGTRHHYTIPKHSLELHFEQTYGAAKLNHKLFPDSTVTEFNELVVRATSTDSWAIGMKWRVHLDDNPPVSRYTRQEASLMRDQWMRDTHGATGHIQSHGVFVHLFLNGLYWGVYNLIERVDADFAESHLPIPAAVQNREIKVDVISVGEALDGSDLTRWNQAKTIADAGDDAAFWALQGCNPSGVRQENMRVYLDMQNYIDYMILHIFASADDWPNNNWYAIRVRDSRIEDLDIEPNDSTGFKFIVWDQEIAINSLDRHVDGWSHATPFEEANQGVAYFYAKLRETSAFQALFKERVQALMGAGGSSTLSVVDLIDLLSLASKLDQPTEEEEVSTYLKDQFSAATQEALANYQGSASDPRPLQTALVGDLNRIIRGPSIYDAQRFEDVTLRAETQQLLAQNPQGYTLLRLNRLLLEDAYPLELSRSRPGGVLTPAANHDRWLERVRQLDRAIVAESARWGGSREFTDPEQEYNDPRYPYEHEPFPYKREHWLNATKWMFEHFWHENHELICNRFKNLDAGERLLPDPFLISLAEDATRSDGESVTLSFTAWSENTSDLGYQWMLNDVDILNANSPQLNLSNLSDKDAGHYRLKVLKGGVLKITSDPVRVTVNRLGLGADFVTEPWFDDAFPSGATPGAQGGDAANWIGGMFGPYSGLKCLPSSIQPNMHQIFFYDASTPVQINQDDVLYGYVYLDPNNLPQTVMLQWQAADATAWEHRAYWGPDLLAPHFGARYSMSSSLPPAGKWVLLEVPASVVGLGGRSIRGMAFTLHGGRAQWDQGGVKRRIGAPAWVDDAFPAGATPGAQGGDSAVWVQSFEPGAYSGAKVLKSSSGSDMHQMFFYDATTPLQINAGDVLYAYVYLNPANPPLTVMLQWQANDATQWEHRAYWGPDHLWDHFGAREYMGPIPSAGRWVRLEVPASAVGLVGRSITGMAFTLHAGQANWDKAGKRSGGDLLWIEDSLPPPPQDLLVGLGDDWSNWVVHNPKPFSGDKAVQSAISNNVHYLAFIGTKDAWHINPGDVMVAYVYLDLQNMPTEVMIQWHANDGTTWYHRAYWGADNLNGFGDRTYRGPLPPGGQWVRLEVPAAAVDLGGRTINGMMLTLYGGRATWDHVGKVAAVSGSTWEDYASPIGAQTGSQGGDSWNNWVEWNPDPHPLDCCASLQSSINAGGHQLSYWNAANKLKLQADDMLYIHVYPDPANPPSEVRVSWRTDDGVWHQEAGWGANLLGGSRYDRGPLPFVDQWNRLEVPVNVLGLAGKTIDGMAFTLYGGQASWDLSGKMSGETILFDDNIPVGASLGATGGDSWSNFATSDPSPFSGANYLRSSPADGEHSLTFSVPYNMRIQDGDVLFAYVYLEPSNPPQEILLVWDQGYAGGAYWGQDLIAPTGAYTYGGALPPTGRWIRLEVSAAALGNPGGTEIAGISFRLYGGRAYWDRAGKYKRLAP